MAITTSVFADDITISMPADTKAEHVDATYQCGSEKVSVTYINAGSVNLARLSIGNAVIIASNVISASGAKYVGGPYVWWSKGSEADLYDLMRDPDMNAPTQCNTLKG
jgi:membrane-bound inhibitor of C-type lysozyme